MVEKDFLAIELVNGCVRYTYDTGNGPRSIHSTLKAAVNDNAWHDIGIIRTELRSQVLVVDDCASYDVQEDARSVHFDLNDDLYIGGVPDHMYQALPRQLKSTDGFHGCIASIAFNGKTRNLMQQIVNTMEGSVHGGCDGRHNRRSWADPKPVRSAPAGDFGWTSSLYGSLLRRSLVDPKPVQGPPLLEIKGGPQTCKVRPFRRAGSVHWVPE